MAKKRKRTTSVKAILVRDFNWRMGNLRRIYCSLHGVSVHAKSRIQRILEEEMYTQESMHKTRLEALENRCTDFITKSQTIQDAIREAQYNERENGSVRTSRSLRTVFDP